VGMMHTKFDLENPKKGRNHLGEKGTDAIII
jgi:hypothetical protein